MPQFDGVYETSTTTGTGAYTLATAKTGYRRFGDVLSDGETCYYFARDLTGGGWERGVGTWNTGHTLARTQILGSSNAGSAVNWSTGTREVFLSQPEELIRPQSAAGRLHLFDTCV